MSRLDAWGLIRLAALPRVAPVVLLGAWMVATANGADHPWIGAVVGCAATLTLLAADRLPVAPLVAAPVGLAVANSTGGLGQEDPWLTLLVCACFCVGRFGGRRYQHAAGVLVLLFVVANIADDGQATTIGDVAFPVLFTAGPWLVGLALQTAARRAADAADHAAEVVASSAAAVDRATAEERLRIARDLHDVVAHNISALSLQAQTVRRRTELGLDIDIAQLRAIEQSAQSAMTDLRQLVGVLRPEEGIAVAGPHEGMAQVSELLATAERVGQQVTLTVRGEARELPPALSLVAYRILQEALANARRHATGEPVSVTLDWSATALTIEVANPLTGLAVRARGHGTTGMMERARLYGGEAQAGPVDGAWVVRARLPVPAELQEAP